MASRIDITSLLVVVLLLAGGCTAIQQRGQGTGQSPAESYTEGYLQQGRISEQRGDPVAALKQYALALTVSPASREALESRERIRKTLDRMADAQYQKGVALMQQGKYGLAGKEFLKALRLRPEHPLALKMLMKRERLDIKRYVLHQIQPGESLAMVADRYYGDYRKFPLIARYNHIGDATLIRVGETLKVPEIEGVPFREKSLEIRTEPDEPPLPVLELPEDFPREIEQQSVVEEVKGEQEQEAQQIALYLDLGASHFQERRYQEALEEFKKVLSVYPQNEVAVDYLYRLHLQEAEELLERNEYLAARDHFREALRYNEMCEACRRGIVDSEDAYKDFHYKMGIRHFGNEQLVAAIDEWGLVMAVDPYYKRTEQLINKARTILKNLEAIRAGERKESTP